MSSYAPQYLIIEWLTRHHDDPDQAREQWLEQRVALLPLGVDIAAVRLTGDLVRAATGTDDPEQIAVTLAEMLDGAVISDRDVYYALINGHAGLVWDMEKDAPCLGKGVYLGVPALDCTTQGSRAPYWVLPPRREGDFCRPDSVRRLVTAGLLGLHAAEC
ncbi:hypothetical protein [Streptomyces sp. NPDC051554]|uniref:hypothetical protein n=1 Tax=Streptomyces sp. NPDC051554 TaxID=3365656 RepID=UPI0037BBDC3A